MTPPTPDSVGLALAALFAMAICHAAIFSAAPTSIGERVARNAAGMVAGVVVILVIARAFK